MPVFFFPNFPVLFVFVMVIDLYLDAFKPVSPTAMDQPAPFKQFWGSASLLDTV